MYEFHGWATFRESTGIGEEDNLEKIIDSVKLFIKELNWTNSGILDIRAVNGEYHLSVSGFTNHKGKDAEDVLNLYKFIAQSAPGSYGMLYIRDDEDRNGNDNSFQVLVLSRGSINERKDQFLSPYIPTVEDECYD
ncbi:MAG: hypothetical protein H6Q73_4467 [Firmicutes bacterium]|nr:hypothetical protein [Bacillota bacterium]